MMNGGYSVSSGEGEREGPIKLHPGLRSDAIPESEPWTLLLQRLVLL